MTPELGLYRRGPWQPNLRGRVSQLISECSGHRMRWVAGDDYRMNEDSSSDIEFFPSTRRPISSPTYTMSRWYGAGSSRATYLVQLDDSWDSFDFPRFFAENVVRCLPSVRTDKTKQGVYRIPTRTLISGQRRSKQRMAPPHSRMCL